MRKLFTRIKPKATKATTPLWVAPPDQASANSSEVRSTSSCQSACEFTANRISILIIRIRSPGNVMTTDARSATGKTGGNMTSARRSVSPLPHPLPPFVLNSTRRALDYELIRILGGAFRCLPTSISYRIERQGSDRGPL